MPQRLIEPLLDIHTYRYMSICTHLQLLLLLYLYKQLNLATIYGHGSTDYTVAEYV